jgi:hypothetical protein
MNAATLIASLTTLDPSLKLEKNAVGNLAIIDAEDQYLGYVDLQTGEIDLMEKDET